MFYNQLGRLTGEPILLARLDSVAFYVSIMSAWYIALLVLQALLGLVMIVLVLLHAPKGEGMGGIGGSASLFSAKRGAEAGLDRLTWSIAGVFVFICVLLGFGFVK
jgi:preprotein translocase subunit SecG